MRIRSVTIFLTACCLSAAAGAQSPRHAADTSWGKPNVSLEDYAVDGGLCAYQAMAADVSDTDAARTLVSATRRLETIETTWGTGNLFDVFTHRMIVEGVRPERLFEDIADLQQGALDDCLRQRGYRQFRLTDDQKRQLRRLRRGSPERRAYLHSLGSDPQVLERQGLHTSPVSHRPQG